MKSERWPHSSPCVRGALVIWRRRVLVANRIFAEIRLVFLDETAGPERVGVIEALVEVDAPVAVGADAFASFLAILGDLADALMGIEDATDRGVAGDWRSSC